MNRAALAAYIDAERRRRARIARASAPFSPSDLFQSGDILLWYDPSDLTTMFKDTAGTQPVTADGQSVALMLDKGQWGGKTLEQVRAAALEKLSSGTIQTLLSPGSTATFNTSTGVGTVYRDASGYSGINFAVAGYVAVDITSDSTALALRNAQQSGTVLKTVSVGRNTYIVGPVTSLSLSMIANSSANITVHSVKVIPGYHREQATGTSMPKYKTDGTLHWLLYDGTDDSHATGTIPFNTVTSDGLARRNLLVDPDGPNHTTWSFDASTGSGVTLTGGLASDGATQLAVFNEGTSNSAHRVNQSTTVSAGAAVTISAEIKAGTSRYVLLGTNRGGIVIDTDTWTITETVAPANTTTTNGAIAALGDGLYRASVTVSHTTDTTVFFVIGTALTGTPGSMAPAFTGTSRTAVFTFAQFELGSTATDFQNIGTDGVAICAGVTKSSDAAAGVVVELSATSASNNGTFALLAPSSAAANYFWRTKGTAASDQTRTTYAAPTTDVLTGMGKIATDSNRFRIDSDEATAATDQGTGNFGSYAMYFGRRGGTSNPFNGREYQTVIRSRLLSASELSSLETFVAEKTGVIL